MAAVIRIAQGTPEWLDYRRTLRNASETPTVLGLSPWMTPYQLWLLKTGRSTPATNEAMAHGSRLEPRARSAYEAQTGAVMNPLVLREGAYSASLDGITLSGEVILEIKCPFRLRQSTLWTSVSQGLIPNHYRMQMQHQLMVSGARSAHLWVYVEGEGILLGVERDEDAMARIRDAWDQFQVYLDTDQPPPLAESDSAIREDEPWRAAAQGFLSAKTAAEAANETLETARKALIALSQHPREQGAGVSVTRVWKPGSVEYKAIPELQGVNMDRFRGKGREEIRISAIK